MVSLRKVIRRMLGIKKYDDTKIRCQLNMFYEMNHPNLKLCYPRVATRDESLKELLSSNKSLCRFGDGEFSLLFNSSISFQKADPHLTKRLKAVLTVDDPDIMIAIPDLFGDLSHLTSPSRLYWRAYLGKNRSKIYDALDFAIQYYSSNITRPYMDYEDKTDVRNYFENFKSIWKNKNILIIEGSKTKFGLGNDLLEGSLSVKRIAAPPTDAWKKYPHILKKSVEFAYDSIVLAALGPTATILCHDLTKMGIRAIDIGHLDIEYEWFLKSAKVKTAITGKYVNEAALNPKVSDIQDTEFKSQIVAVIE